MTNEEIIKMAREAGWDWPGVHTLSVEERLERFAALISAAERERSKWDGIHSCGPDCSRPPCVTVRKAVEAEREACAVAAEKQARWIGYNAHAEAIAAAIRARSQA